MWYAHLQQNLVYEQDSIRASIRNSPWPVLMEREGQISQCDLFSVDFYFIKSYFIFFIPSHRFLEYFVPFL